MMSFSEKYSFLNDDYAQFEIRKHKWIISEKAGHEIGFATAAVDWIKNYGDTWKFYRFSRLFCPENHMDTSLRR
ncbi:MAG: hypothetical protein AB1650_00645 [Candidatus Omnitrophota bacterium]